MVLIGALHIPRYMDFGRGSHHISKMLSTSQFLNGFVKLPFSCWITYLICLLSLKQIPWHELEEFKDTEGWQKEDTLISAADTELSLSLAGNSPFNIFIAEAETTGYMTWILAFWHVFARASNRNDVHAVNLYKLPTLQITQGLEPQQF